MLDSVALYALEHAGTLGAIGGQDALVNILNDACLPAGVDFKARELRRFVVARKVQECARTLGSDVEGFKSYDEADLPRLLTQYAEDISRMAHDARPSSAPTTLPGLAEGILSDLDAEEDHVVPTGIRDLDDLLSGGLRGGQLVSVGGRTAVGKSMLCNQITLNAARARFSVLYLTLEMSQREVARRLLSNVSGVPARDISATRISFLQRASVERAREALAKLPITIEMPVGTTPHALSALIRSYVLRGRIDLVVVDHLGLIAVPKARAPSTTASWPSHKG